MRNGLRKWTTFHCAYIYFLYYILPKGYSQKSQHNFPSFLELFSNLYYITANHTADRSIVLAQKHPNFTLKVCNNGPMVLLYKTSVISYMKLRILQGLYTLQINYVRLIQNQIIVLLDDWIRKVWTPAKYGPYTFAKFKIW